ncbi:MAG: DUF45 domain-containing protein [Proteobacteria bacterium]|nr:DUF45 domain-containing protein [Pseudomonadota bacterium]
MVKSTTLEIDGIGPVLFERSTRARHLSISVKPFSGVRVAVPRRVSFRAARQFVAHKREWIIKHQERMRKLEVEHEEYQKNRVKIDKRAARQMLVARLEHLSGKYGFSYNRVYIRNQKTLWGSCSHKNNISLNIRLAELPEELSDYVIIHELVHTRVKSHCARFWDELHRYVPDAKGVDKELRKYQLVVA